MIEFYMIFTQKMSEFYMKIAQKYFPKFWGAHMPPAPASYAYVLNTNTETFVCPECINVVSLVKIHLILFKATC